MTVTLIPEVMQDMTESHYRQQVYIVAETQMHVAPWLFEDEGWEKSRLKAAIELVCTGKVTERTDGWEVLGSATTYGIPRETLTCPCKAAQHGSKSKICKHRVAVELARRVQQAYPQETPLPLPPVTVDERLAHPVQPWMVATPPPKEARMPVDDPSIPEPDDRSATAVLEPPAAPPVTRPLPGPVEPVRVSIPAEYVMSIKGKRHVLYAGLVIGAQRSGLLTLSADWTYNDAELSLAHAVCTFADGRRYEDSGDASPSNVNKGIAAHFRRVALTRAKARCLRDALGIQECSVEELEGDESKPERETPDMTRPLSEKELRQRIWAQVQKMDATVRSRDQVEAFIKERTGMTLHPDFYEAIYNRLQP